MFVWYKWVIPNNVDSHALTVEKPYINKDVHMLLMHGFTAFHMQESVQYSISTEANGFDLWTATKAWEKLMTADCSKYWDR